MVKLALLIAAVAILGLTGCSTGGLADNGQMGVLRGNVTIGPIWPVERPEGNPPIPPEVYEARKIMVYDEQGTKLIEQVDIVPGDEYGYYRIELKAGKYIVDINSIGIDRSAQVPAEIEITPGQTLQLDMDVDTGIR